MVTAACRTELERSTLEGELERTLGELPGEVANHLSADEDHSSVAELVVRRLRVGSLGGDLCEAVEHLVPRDFDVVEAGPCRFSLVRNWRESWEEHPHPLSTAVIPPWTLGPISPA